MARLVVTGATGFIGRELVLRLAASETHKVIAASRRPVAWDLRHISSLALPDIDEALPLGALESVFAGAEVVVHLAGMTPASNRLDSAAMLSTNVGGVERLGKAALLQGVKKFILVSTTLVSGSRSTLHAISETSPSAPDSAYAHSKLMGERALIELAAGSAMSWTIIRPPLVYGAGVNGALKTLTRAAISPIPLPFGAVTTNQRDMIGVGNLCHFVMRCLDQPAADDQCFVVRDGEAISTQALIETLAAAAGRKAIQLPVPRSILAACARLSTSVARMVDDYRIDDTKARDRLDWHAPYGMAVDLEKMVRAVQGNAQP